MKCKHCDHVVPPGTFEDLKEMKAHLRRAHPAEWHRVTRQSGAAMREQMRKHDELERIVAA
jgi:hypothetical protein